MMGIFFVLGMIVANFQILCGVSDASVATPIPPQRTTGGDTFSVRRESWNSPDTEPGAQLENGITLVYGTFFQNLEFLARADLSQFEREVSEQSLLMRRLYLMLGLGGIWYRPEGGGEAAPWPFPFAAVLTQGQRVTVVLEDITPAEFLNFLTAENPDLFYRRRYSSHGVKLDRRTNEVREYKNKNPFRRIQSTETILGMDFPFGGVGSPLPNGNRVGPQGKELQETARGFRIVRGRQIGHLHLYMRFFPSPQGTQEITRGRTVVMLGFEGCAPGTSNQFGCNHNLLSGITNQRRNPSVSGGAKWSRLRFSTPPPAEYNGKSVSIDRPIFEEIKNRIGAILSFKVTEQKKLFEKFLKMEGFQATGFLWTYNEWIAE